MDQPVSPLAPTTVIEPAPVPGVRLATRACGVRYQGRTDVLLALFDPGTTVAGVLTQSVTRSAPVEWCARGLADGRARALVVNAGNANTFTGLRGTSSVENIATAAAATAGCAPGEVFVSSTGTIGEFLPDARITLPLPEMAAEARADGWVAAARAIMTTDTYPKTATAETHIGGVPVRLSGIAKGSGMIAPDMATMLAYVATDAALPADVLRALLGPAADASFNSITVDGDTSTSDTLLLFATGQAGHAPVTGPDDPALAAFRTALNGLLLDLAHQVVRDGEGASRFVELRVTGAESDRAARRIGLAIGNSPLVKTAIAGADANWGRIVMAVGKAGERADRDRLAIRIGGVPVCADGLAVPGYDEAPVAAHMKGRDILIEVDVGIGQGSATVWTCDLTHGYIDINADYRS
ncbi:bifunctional glutamate N-acetyltransferase/amino-acid acetyltransferase ArgJ [Roseospira visakhapatnamensis]|uniref:Arginine biosynthesis bifunctional protein ArgJ n=1 Tax=Roseospira visakhapatnamensis TaxID=390880 RepID=A0A7W6RHJ1_9PROT|nr:bifunctional glutamate N-acetyltransferase/amino-acid acetyltransferase ArgJ [Roseospira visakhapatnamensis]MBB4268139.1 glutamate N-acetyltransferase/amino-acid N-acetyltransferase [Roseospira visakhapatnamensis]